MLEATVIASRSSGPISYSGLESQKKPASGSSASLSDACQRGLGDVHSEILQYIEMIFDADLLPPLINISAAKFAVNGLILQDMVHNGEQLTRCGYQGSLLAPTCCQSPVSLAYERILGAARRPGAFRDYRLRRLVAVVDV